MQSWCDHFQTVQLELLMEPDVIWSQKQKNIYPVWMIIRGWTGKLSCLRAEVASGFKLAVMKAQICKFLHSWGLQGCHSGENHCAICLQEFFQLCWSLPENWQLPWPVFQWLIIRSRAVKISKWEQQQASISQFLPQDWWVLRIWVLSLLVRCPKWHVCTPEAFVRAHSGSCLLECNHFIIPISSVQCARYVKIPFS